MLQNNKPAKRKWPWHWFRPDYLVNTVADIDFAYLERQGVKAIFIDLDGTVVSRNTFEVSERTMQVLHDQPIEIFIATNRPKSRNLKNLREDLDASGVVHPYGIWCKPFPAYYQRALRLRNLRPEEAVMVGDRYIQDICGGNLSGLRTIVVRKLGPPINRRDRLISSLEARRSTKLAKRYQPIT